MEFRESEVSGEIEGPPSFPSPFPRHIPAEGRKRKIHGRKASEYRFPFPSPLLLL